MANFWESPTLKRGEHQKHSIHFWEFITEMKVDILKRYCLLSLLALVSCLVCASQVWAQGATEANQSGPFSVAVLDFDRSQSSGASSDATRAIPNILTTELANSDRFTVVEREQLKAVMQEQNFGTSGRVSAETAARIGQILGVEYLVMGNITELNIERGKSRSGSFLGISTSHKDPDRAKVSIELKVVDSESARIVATASCRRSFDIGKGSDSTNIGIIRNTHTDNGTSDSAMANLYYAIAKDLADQLNTARFKTLPPKVKYNGFVAHVEGDKAYINLGSKQGITQKLVFNVRRDEQKGTIKFKRTIGEIPVINVDEEASECQIIKMEGPDKIKTGDLVESKF